MRRFPTKFRVTSILSLCSLVLLQFLFYCGCSFVYNNKYNSNIINKYHKYAYNCYQHITTRLPPAARRRECPPPEIQSIYILFVPLWQRGLRVCGCASSGVVQGGIRVRFITKERCTIDLSASSAKCTSATVGENATIGQ